MYASSRLLTGLSGAKNYMGRVHSDHDMNVKVDEEYLRLVKFGRRVLLKSSEDALTIPEL
jgi:hypothetical protein